MSQRIYHLAHKIRPDGDVSPWCAKKPRTLNLARESWVLDYDRSTCPRCKAAYRASNRPTGG